jgi:hypothetical protein
MSWLLSMYGEDEPGDQENTYFDLAPRIIECSIQEQMENAQFTGILENTPRQIVDPTPTGVNPLLVGAGVAGAAAIGASLYFGYHTLAHRKSPEQQVKEDSFGNKVIKQNGVNIIKKSM